MWSNLYQVPSGGWRVETLVLVLLANYSGLKQGSGLHSAVKLSVNRGVGFRAAGGCFLNLLLCGSAVCTRVYLQTGDKRQRSASARCSSRGLKTAPCCFSSLSSPSSVWKAVFGISHSSLWKDEQSPTALFGGKLTHEPDDPPGFRPCWNF